MDRIALPSDLDGIVSLWQEAFGDSPQEIERFFAAFPQCLSYVTEDVSAMVHALPQTLSPDIPAAYVYAVATRQDRRGRGLCRRLMAFAEQDLKKRGFACCVLVPGEQPLFDFYRGLGYETCFTGRPVEACGGEEIGVRDYLALRERLLTVPHMIYGEATLHYAASLYGLRFYRTDTGCCAASPDFTAERLPEGLGDEPRGMVKWLAEPRRLQGGFLGFSLA